MLAIAVGIGLGPAMVWKFGVSPVSPPAAATVSEVKVRPVLLPEVVKPKPVVAKRAKKPEGATSGDGQSPLLRALTSSGTHPVGVALHGLSSVGPSGALVAAFRAAMWNQQPGRLTSARGGCVNGKNHSVQ